jgi:recombination protein RecA
VEHGVIKKAGTWYSYGETKIGQGRENARQFLIENPDVGGVVEAEVMELLGLAVPESLAAVTA